MDDNHNVIFLQFCDVTKQKCMVALVWGLYMGEIAIHFDDINKI